jgi:hypothetical protein
MLAPFFSPRFCFSLSLLRSAIAASSPLLAGINYILLAFCRSNPLGQHIGNHVHPNNPLLTTTHSLTQSRFRLVQRVSRNPRSRRAQYIHRQIDPAVEICSGAHRAPFYSPSLDATPFLYQTTIPAFARRRKRESSRSSFCIHTDFLSTLVCGPPAPLLRTYIHNFTDSAGSSDRPSTRA